MNIQIKAVCRENEEEIMQLRVQDTQTSYIESVSECLKEAHQASLWRPVGIYLNDRLIGFAMYGFFKNEGENGRVWLDRFFIDQRYQGKGYSKRVMISLLDRIRKEYACTTIYLSVYEENEVACRLYLQLGFRFQGEEDIHGEKVMVGEESFSFFSNL